MFYFHKPSVKIKENAEDGEEDEDADKNSDNDKDEGDGDDDDDGDEWEVPETIIYPVIFILLFDLVHMVFFNQNLIFISNLNTIKEEDEICSICTLPITTGKASLMCGHEMCIQCMTHLKEFPTGKFPCPWCRYESIICLVYLVIILFLLLAGHFSICFIFCFFQLEPIKCKGDGAQTPS